VFVSAGVPSTSETPSSALHDLPPLSSVLFLVLLFQLLLCASASAGGSTPHPADLSKVSLLGQFPSSSSIFMSLNSQVACVLLSAGPLLPPLELKQGHCMIRCHAVRSNCDRHPCRLVFCSSWIPLVESFCCLRPRCRRLGFSAVSCVGCCCKEGMLLVRLGWFFCLVYQSQTGSSHLSSTSSSSSSHRCCSCCCPWLVVSILCSIPSSAAAAQTLSSTLSSSSSSSLECSSS
jgi:hypothetical protein